MWVLQATSRVIKALFPPVLLIALAYFSAVFTSAAVYVFLAEMLRPPTAGTGGFSSGFFLRFIAFAVFFAVPGVCAALVGWEKRYRNVLYYALAWGVAGLIISAVPQIFPDFRHDDFTRLRWLVWAASGASGGTVYWIGAGRYTRGVSEKRGRKSKLADDHYSER